MMQPIPIHIDQLPVEVLTMIFSYLKQDERAKTVLLVSKRWNSIGNDPHVWQNLNIDYRGTTDAVIRLVSKCTFIKSIKVSTRDDLVDIFNEANTYEDCFNNMQGSSLGKGFIGDKYNWPTLRRLELKDVILHGFSFGRNLCSLTELSISGDTSVTTYNLRLITLNCTRLVCLTLRQLAYEEGEGRWNSAFLEFFIKRGAALQSLKIDAVLLTDTTLGALCVATGLRTLSLERAIGLSSAGFAAISAMNNLKYLSLGFCPKLNEEEAKRLFSPGNLGLVEELMFSRCTSLTDKCLKFITNACPHIYRCQVFGSPFVSQMGIRLLILKCKNLTVETRMRHSIIIRGRYLQKIPGQKPRIRTVRVSGLQISHKLDPELS